MKSWLSGRRARLMTGAAGGFALLFAAGGAQAQDASSGDEQEIVVTGFRQSVESSVATKRDENSIVEAVTAEDIGKLPDVSIAESLGRLPGLATQRVNGRSSVLSIRGLGPDLSTALLNGREQVSTSDNRGVEFDQYPAELLSSAVVYKTPYAGLIGQGLAGTADLRTIRPLATDGRILSFSGRYEFNEGGALNPDADGDGYRVTGTYVNQFMDGTFGVALGLAMQSTPTQDEMFNAWGYNDGFLPSGAGVIGGIKPFIASNELERLGVMTTLQWRPSAAMESTVDLFYSDFSEDQTIRGIEFPFAWGAGVTLTDEVVENGLVTAGTFHNVFGVMRNDINQRRAELFSAGWNLQFDTGGWDVETDVSYSKADRHDDLIETYSGTGYNRTGAPDTIAFRRNSDGTISLSSSIDYADPAGIVLTDPQGWGSGSDLVQAGFVNSPDTRDELWHVRGSISRDLDADWADSIEFGLDYGSREKEREIGQRFLVLPGYSTSLSGGATQESPIPAAALLDSSASIAFMGIPAQINLNPLYLVNNFLVSVPTSLSSFNVPQAWVVSEDVLTGWVKLNLDTAMGSVPVTGNLGIQVVQTEQTSDGSRVSSASGTPVLEPVSGGDEYTEVLPSANLIFALGEDTRLRFGAARTLARPRMDQLNASLSLSVNQTRLTSTDPNQAAFSASGGNPELRPYIANQVDLSLEHYFGGAGYVAAAVFYKDLEDFVNPNDAFLFDFAAFVTTELTPAQQAILGTSLGTISGPTNRGEGHIQGVELSLSLPGDLISDALSPFGLITSASFVDSEVLLGGSTSPISVPGLSDTVVNTTIYYEQNGFEARLSHRYRGEFLAEVTGISATRNFRMAQSESILDAQIGYAFQSGPLERLRLTAQGLNLTDEAFVTFSNNDPRRVIDHQQFGRTFLVGASYRF